MTQLFAIFTFRVLLQMNATKSDLTFEKVMSPFDLLFVENNE